MSQFIKLYFTSSMLSMFRTLIHHQELRLFCCITTLVVCSSFCVWWSFGVAGLGWYPCGRLCFILPHGYHPNPATPKLHHTQKEEQSMWWYNRKVAAPDDGCINVRNMLSIEEVKQNLLWHQVGLLFLNCFILFCLGPLSADDVGLEKLGNYVDQAIRSTASKVRFQPWQKLRFISRLEMEPT